MTATIIQLLCRKKTKRKWTNVSISDSVWGLCNMEFSVSFSIFYIFQIFGNNGYYHIALYFYKCMRALLIFKYLCMCIYVPLHLACFIPK